jgi:hypothetical protein
LQAVPAAQVTVASQGWPSGMVVAHVPHDPISMDALTLI